VARQIPMTEGLNPQKKLTDEATVAQWNSEGLPSDELSVDNGTIITTCTRWPLIIDPQLQGITWIRSKEEKNNLISLQLTQRGYMDRLVKGLEDGAPILIENIGESIDPVLEPVISRSFISKGRRLVLKLGEKEVDVACAKDEGVSRRTSHSSSSTSRRSYLIPTTFLRFRRRRRSSTSR